ncbi:MAG: hypothetical protein JWM12_3340 [Ilumatobacteraceae bacterium]|nr:hypothetical protein [Ilumatobacteraceae bacterium]
MAQYAMLLYYDADHYWTTDEEVKHSPEYAEFGQTAGAAGVLRGGQALHGPTMATTITVAGGKGGDVIVTDGPYAEAKEVLGGFYLVEAADLDEAIRWGSQIPAAWRGRVEVRPVFEMNDAGQPVG